MSLSIYTILYRLQQKDKTDYQFIMFIPGFNGYLTTRFDIMEKDWRSKNIFSLNPRMITEAKVIDPHSADSSFTLSLKDSTYSIQTSNGKTLSRIDFGKLHNFLIGFGNTNYEMIFEKMPSTFKDSLLKAGPFKIIEVRSFTGELKQVSLYRKIFTGVSMNPNDDDDVKAGSQVSIKSRDEHDERNT